MAAAATSSYTWRFVFGNAEDWARPEYTSLSGVHPVAESAVTWRVMFGNTSAWLPPQSESRPPLSGNALAELCELCRQPIDPGEDFITNSAGQQPAHTRCLNLESPASAKQRPGPIRWLSLLRDLVISQ